MLLRILQWAVAVPLMLVWLVKAYDYNISLVALLFPRSKLAWRLSKGGRHWRDPAWTPVFYWAAENKRAGGVKGVLVRLVDTVFRLPVLCGMMTVAVLLSLEIAHYDTRNCTTPYHAATDILWFVVALMGAIAAIGIPVFFLAVAIRSRSQHHRRISGHAWLRTTPTGPIMNSLVSVLATTLTLILSYAALYRAIWVVWPRSFHFDSCAHQLLDAIYFSVVTAATVGFGEVHPSKQAAEIIVASQIVVVATALALYVQAVIASRD